MQAAAQFTPEQLIVAGRRAEAQGQTAYALQFYRFLAEKFPNTTEAFEARDALYRLTSPAPAANGHDPHARVPAPGAAPDTALRTGPPIDTRRQQRRAQVSDATARPAPIAPPRGFRIGRLVAGMLNTIGWLLLLAVMVAGPLIIMALTVGGVPRGIRDLVIANLPMFIAGSVGALFLGLFAVFAGQVARATFDSADLTRWIASALSPHDEHADR
jgi:hypothetical protein